MNEQKARIMINNIFNRLKIIKSAVDLNMLVTNKQMVIDTLDELADEAERLLEDLRD